MKSAPFKMHSPITEDEVLDLLKQYGEDARVIAGGQTLVPVLAMRVASPDHLIDINKIASLKRFEVNKNQLEVYAGVRQSELEQWHGLGEAQPLLKMMFPWIAHTPIRNRGTVCGSIAHADPSAELVLALTVLEGTVTLVSAKRKRNVNAANFFIGALQTDRQPDELIQSVQFPLKNPNAGFGFAEFGYRHGDFAVVAVAVIKDGDKWTVGFGGIDDVAKIYKTTAKSIEEVMRFIDDLATEIEVREDPTATSGLRRHLMRTLGKQACMDAERFKGSSSK
jgi:2-furoyl-CoA dehydrogenase FAD binding subunit